MVARKRTLRAYYAGPAPSCSIAHATLAGVDRPSPEQIAIYRAMTPAERWRQAEALYWSARRLREAHERALHPDWTDDQIRDRVRRIFLRAAT
jgi:hypothetical protein